MSDEQAVVEWVDIMVASSEQAVVLATLLADHNDGIMVCLSQFKSGMIVISFTNQAFSIKNDGEVQEI